MAYTDSVLPNILLKADQVWADNQTKDQYKAKTDAFRAVERVNTATIGPSLSGKDKTVSVAWINACAIEAEACAASCTIGGNELTTDKSDYTISNCQEAKFKVPEQTFRSNLFDYTELVAKGIMRGMKGLDEKIVQAFVTFLNANGGANAWTGSSKWTVSGNDTNIPAANWADLGLMFDFLYAGQQNRFEDPVLFTGFNMSEPLFKAVTNQGNLDGKGEFARASTLPLFQDTYNVEAINGSTLKTYMIDTGAVAFASKNYYDRVPRELPGVGHVLFSRPSNSLPGVVYDITYTVTCTGGVYYHEYKIEAHFDYFLNPTGCTATRTGILEFVRVA
jgi:hypothetical protein